MHGKVVYSQTQSYDAGKHKEILRLSVPEGVYTLSIKGKTVNLNTLVIRKS